MSQNRILSESAESASGADTGRQKIFGRARPYLLLVLLGLIASWPLLVHGMPDLSNDGPDHARYDNNFASQFWHGESYPRWLSSVNGGLGGAPFFFYPPMQSYAATMFWPLLRGHDPFGWLVSGYACILATILGGVFAFKWLRSFADPPAALFGAAVYMIAPYHLAMDLYNRGAAAEYWIFVWLPLLMLAAQGILSGVRYSVAGLAVVYALCVYSHATVAACSAALPVAWVLIFSEPKRRWRATLSTIFGLTLGIGLSAIFLLPAVLDQSKAWVASQTEGWNDYRNWWLFSIRDKITEIGTIGSGIPWYLSAKMRLLVITIWAVIFSGTSYWLVWRYSSSGKARRIAAFYIGLTIFGFFLMLRQSEFVWRLIPLLPLLEFPSRLGTFLVMAAAALSSLAFTGLKRKGAGYATAVILISLAGWAASDAVSARQAYSAWRYIPAKRAVQSASMTRLQEEEYAYWPKSSRVKELLPVEELEKFLTAHPPKEAHLTGGAAAGSAVVESWEPRSVLLKVDAPAAGQLVLNHFYMEGWRARLAGSPADLPVSPSPPDGLIEVSVPAGANNLVVDLPPDRAEQTGKLVSLLSLGILTAMLLASKLKLVRQTKD